MSAHTFVPSKVTKIDKQAFYGCKKLKTITIKSTKLKTVGKNALKGINSKATIKVPKSKLSAYKKLLKGKGQGSKVKIVKYN
ncbi:MAG: leucine-rich repeat protein [Agathobacter sp.]|nr:leucine-rich repeat protein [Agathobacter sp.]